MPIKTFGTEVFTSSDVNTYLMTQVIIRCTSITRPASPAEGWFIYEMDTKRLLTYKSGVWSVQRSFVDTTVMKTVDTVTDSTIIKDDELKFTLDKNSTYYIRAYIKSVGTVVADTFQPINLMINAVGISTEGIALTSRDVPNPEESTTEFRNIDITNQGLSTLTTPNGTTMEIKAIVRTTTDPALFHFSWRGQSGANQLTLKAGTWVSFRKL